MTTPIKTFALLGFLLVTPQLISTNAIAEESTAQAPNPQQWMAEIMGNVDFELFMRIQKVVVENMAIIGPYTQEYYLCLKDKGALEQKAGSTANFTLDQLIEGAKTKGKSCNPIVEKLFSEMQFDITEEEFERGLSPEYKKKFQSLKGTI